MDKFEIGEVAIYVRPGSPHYGKEVTVLSGLRPAASIVVDVLTGVESYGAKNLVYEITDLYPALMLRAFTARPEWLRKKPKRQDAREWFNQNITLDNKVPHEIHGDNL